MRDMSCPAEVGHVGVKAARYAIVEFCHALARQIPEGAVV